MLPNGQIIRRRRVRRGYTLLEAVIASGILLGSVLAVVTPIMAGQQNAFEAQQRVAGNLAAEELMGRLLNESYDSLPAWSGFTEPAGTLTDVTGDPMSGPFASVGRTVSVVTIIEELPEYGVRIRGHEVRVVAFDTQTRDLASLTWFVPDPGP